MNFSWLEGVHPGWGTGLLSLAYGLLLFWVFRRPASPEDAEDHGSCRDLRWWVLLLVASQVLLYWIF